MIRVSLGDDVEEVSMCDEAVVEVEVSMGRDVVIDVDDASIWALIEVSVVPLDRLTWSSKCVILGHINCGKADMGRKIWTKQHNS